MAPLAPLTPTTSLFPERSVIVIPNPFARMRTVLALRRKRPQPSSSFSTSRDRNCAAARLGPRHYNSDARVAVHARFRESGLLQSGEFHAARGRPVHDPEPPAAPRLDAWRVELLCGNL